MIARHILAEYAENPGIRPGDMFICNDPYVGAVHQNCVTLVGPLHHGERLIGWCGATLHLVDVGGATTGQVGIGARSIFEEAPVIPPLKIVSGGLLLKDVEAYQKDKTLPKKNFVEVESTLVDSSNASTITPSDKLG